jgi:hypothetical protein
MSMAAIKIVAPACFLTSPFFPAALLSSYIYLSAFSLGPTNSALLFLVWTGCCSRLFLSFHPTDLLLHLTPEKSQVHRSSGHRKTTTRIRDEWLGIETKKGTGEAKPQSQVITSIFPSLRRSSVRRIILCMFWSPSYNFRMFGLGQIGTSIFK